MNAANFNIVIPARFESTRLPGKVLLDIAGKPMLQHVWERASECGSAEVVIATDSEKVAAAASGFGADVCMTSPDCHSGTDRVSEVSVIRDWAPDSIVVNVQGDAPLMPPQSIGRVARLLEDHADASIGTACVPLQSKSDYLDPNVVKVVTDRAGNALYFSRSPIPHGGHGADAENGWRQSFRHLGLYAYRVAALRTLSATAPCALEISERLEQLRALWLGMTIQVCVDEVAHGPDVDTQADIEAVAEILRGQGSSS